MSARAKNYITDAVDDVLQASRMDPRSEDLHAAAFHLLRYLNSDTQEVQGTDCVGTRMSPAANMLDILANEVMRFGSLVGGWKDGVITSDNANAMSELNLLHSAVEAYREAGGKFVFPPVGFNTATMNMEDNDEHS